jgi:hypothetical protein
VKRPESDAGKVMIIYDGIEEWTRSDVRQLGASSPLGFAQPLPSGLLAWVGELWSVSEREKAPDAVSALSTHRLHESHLQVASKAILVDAIITSLRAEFGTP